MEGFDAKFDPALDKRLECPICLLAQREPMQTPCGHRFCSACILRALRETGPRCPVDNTRVAVHQLFKDNFAKREVLSLHVRCHADDHGCVWNGELRDLEEHERTCDLITITCPNECGHRCQRKDLFEHLPSCSNQPTSCPFCSICFTKDKVSSHAEFCSRLKLPDATLEVIAKANEILKWCGHLKMKLHGQSYTTTGYLTAKMDSDERFIHSGCWSSNISLIPLTGPAARIFWRTLQGPEVKPVNLYFNVLTVDSRATTFQKMIKKKINAVVGLRLKPSSRRELMILYIHWSEPHKRMIACVAELRNYLVREMQSKLQQLKRTSQFTDITLESSRPGPSHRNGALPNNRLSGERGGSSRRGYNGPVRIVSIPPQPSGSGVSVDNSSHLTPASHVLPSILSWQLSPSFPAYPWRVQPAAPGVPFFTIPSTPPQFLPAHSYPYTFAPMPAIAAPPFSINPIQPVPASIAIPSYAGVAVPQVTGLHAELVVSSASNGPSLQGAPNFVEGSGNAGGIPHIPAATVIHQFPQPAPDPLSVPTHPVNQVSVVVDPRINSSGIPGEIPEVGMVNRDILPSRDVWPADIAHWRPHQVGGASSNRWLSDARESTIRSFGPSSYSTPSPSHSLMQSSSSNSTRHNSDLPGPSNASPDISRPPGVHHPRQTSSPSSSINSPVSLSFFSPLAPGGLEQSDDDTDIDSPLQWAPISNPSQSASSNSGTPSTGSGDDEGTQHSPASQQRAMGSALQTLADAAAFLSSSPQSESSSDDVEETLIVAQQRNPPTRQEPNILIDSDSFNSEDSFSNFTSSPTSTVPSSHYPPSSVSSASSHSNQVPSNHHGNILSVPTQGYPTAALPGFHHQPSGLEDLPVFVPVIHPTVEPLEPTQLTGPTPSQILYTPQDGGVVVPPQPPIAEVPPLIHVAQGSRNIMPVSDPWPAIVEPGSQTAFMRSRPIMQAPSGGFWEEVMPSLDMRLHESHTSQSNM